MPRGLHYAKLCHTFPVLINMWEPSLMSAFRGRESNVSNADKSREWGGLSHIFAGDFMGSPTGGPLITQINLEMVIKGNLCAYVVRMNVATSVMLTFVGNVLGPSPVPTIVHCLARRDGTDEFYNLKVRPQAVPSVAYVHLPSSSNLTVFFQLNLCSVLFRQRQRNMAGCITLVYTLTWENKLLYMYMLSTKSLKYVQWKIENLA